MKIHNLHSFDNLIVGNKGRKDISKEWNGRTECATSMIEVLIMKVVRSSQVEMHKLHYHENKLYSINVVQNYLGYNKVYLRQDIYLQK